MCERPRGVLRTPSNILVKWAIARTGHHVEHRGLSAGFLGRLMPCLSRFRDKTGNAYLAEPARYQGLAAGFLARQIYAVLSILADVRRLQQYPAILRRGDCNSARGGTAALLGKLRGAVSILSRGTMGFSSRRKRVQSIYCDILASFVTHGCDRPLLVRLWSRAPNGY